MCQNRAIRWITGGFCMTLIGVMEFLSGIPPIQIMLNILVKNLHLCFKKLHHNHLISRHITNCNQLNDSRAKKQTASKRPRKKINVMDEAKDNNLLVDEFFLPLH